MGAGFLGRVFSHRFVTPHPVPAEKKKVIPQRAMS